MNHRPHLTALALFGTLLGAGCAAGAQSATQPTSPQAAPPAAHAHREGAMNRAIAGLGLTDDQLANVRAARRKYRESRKTSTPETRDQLQTDVESSMTANQKTRFEANMKSIRAQMRAERKQQS